MKSIFALLLALTLITTEVSVSGQRKRPNRKPSSLSGYITGHFDSKVDKLPANFKGHYIEGVFLAVKGLTPPKNEYEKTDQYIARLVQYAGNSQYAFRFDPEIDKGWVTYDADAEVLKVSGYSMGVFESEMTQRYLTTESLKYSKIVGSSYVILDGKESIRYYTASNAFGRRARVRRSQRVCYNIADNKELPKWHFELKASPSDAIRLKPLLSILYVCELAVSNRIPLITFDYIIQTEPTISDPEEYIVNERCLMVNVQEIWLYNRLTGEIYQKQKLDS